MAFLVALECSCYCGYGVLGGSAHDVCRVGCCECGSGRFCCFPSCADVLGRKINKSISFNLLSYSSVSNLFSWRLRCREKKVTAISRFLLGPK